MSYPPPQYQVNNRDHLIEVIKNFPLATLISISDNTPVISHLPLIYSDGKLIGHLDASNPQARLLKNENEVTVIFSGPQCYISPCVFTHTALPTWNYVKVHLKGTVTEIKNEDHIIDSMIEMTSFLEEPNPRYILERDNERMAKFISYVQGFEITIQDWEGKFKLSQDKKPIDMELAKEALIKANTRGISAFLDRVLSDQE